MRRIPIVPTLLVALAVAAMIALGVWQLHRMAWKEALLQRYAQAAHRAEIAYPQVVTADTAPLFRQAHALCLQVVGWRAVSGRNRAEEPGYAHVAACRTGAEGSGMQVAVGWSQSPDPPHWSGGPVRGVIAPDSRSVIRLVAERAPPGLQPLEPPSLQSIPNNHFGYALQWFAFAATAALIYAAALAQRFKGHGRPPVAPPPYRG